MDDLAKWMAEHLQYELDMLRYTLARVQTLTEGGDWNAFYESFAIHARNLYEFLTNDAGPGNRNAKEYVQGYVADKSDETKGIKQKLLKQVFHLERGRPTDAERKLNSDDCAVLARWIEGHLIEFRAALPEKYKARLILQKQNLDDPTLAIVGVRAPQASSEPFSVSSVSPVAREKK